MPRPPGVLALYPMLQETPLGDPVQRTEWNVRDSDALMVLLDNRGLCSNGTERAILFAHELGRPVLVLDVTRGGDVSRAVSCLRASGEAERIVCIAGPRESGSWKRAHPDGNLNVSQETAPGRASSAESRGRFYRCFRFVPCPSLDNVSAAQFRGVHEPGSTRLAKELQEQSGAEAPGAVDQQRIIEARPKRWDRLALDRRYDVNARSTSARRPRPGSSSPNRSRRGSDRGTARVLRPIIRPRTISRSRMARRTEAPGRAATPGGPRE